jgi:chromosome segregation protein
MYLKSITLKGFKSFPDRTRLEFGPGVSVVVGPNGSGKSNITDAVLWALGEQSPVAVRGQSMQDVIFGGAPGRQAAGGAEVELILDDSEGALALGAPEVSVVRRLDRTGDGEYRLAGARCRLVDVIELLSDTGLGKEMHSVISQGRVEAIVTSKPRDRRLLIEEAAGLGKHRKRRRRAQLKLARTQDNLDRALDVEREARSRLRPLKRQAEAAELHARLERQTLEARWQVARDDVRLERIALADAQAAAAQARQRRERVEAELQAVSERREAAEEALAARSEQREELARRCFVARSAQERIAERAEAIRATGVVVEQRLVRQRELLARIPARRELERELEALERDLAEELAALLNELQRELEAATEALARHETAVERARAARDQRELECDKARGALRDAEREVERARREVATVGAELATVNDVLRAAQHAPGGASPLADALEVDPGYELALAAALDGRLRAAVVSDRPAAAELLDRAGPDGGRALVAIAEGSAGSEDKPVPASERLLDHVRGAGHALSIARALLRDTWVVDDLSQVADRFGGVAVTRTGRVWSPRTGELRQAAAVGDERLLAERNRREQLARESDAAVRTEQIAHGALASAAAKLEQFEADRQRAADEHRAAIRARDDAAEEVRRLATIVERRRSEPGEGAAAARFAQLRAELAASRDLGDRVERDQALAPAVAAAVAALQRVADAIGERRASFDADLNSDREAGEQVAAQLRSCAQEEAALHARLHSENEALTELEVGAQRLRDRAAEGEQQLTELAQRLGLAATPADQALADEEREALNMRMERLTRRREQLGPVNPLAEQEYAEAVEHVGELERQRSDLETALRELEKLIADTDRQIRETFELTFAAAAHNFEELAGQLFPGGRGQLRLVSEPRRPARILGGESEGAEAEDAPDADDEDDLGVEIEITPAGKDMKRLSLLSGGEKSMTALAFLFAVFLAKPCPFYILDEVEAALDDVNIDRFLALLRRYSKQSQFIVVTHQKRTMEAADSLYGVSMGGDGISKVISRRLPADELAA